MPAQKSDFVVGEIIGKGSFGICKKVRRIADGRQLVWKELDYGSMSPQEKEMLVSEVNILRDLHHPNIVRYYDRIIDRDHTTIYIVMEHCPGGDLEAKIKKATRQHRDIDENLIWKWFQQILSAVQFCHSKTGGPVMHRDLKPANIFLDRDQNVKIGDFGLARALSSTQLYARTYVGTPYYMSPEQLNEIGYNEKSDIWSIGCLIYQLAFLCPPFEARNQAELKVVVNKGRFKRLPATYSADLYDTVKLMLQNDPNRRASADELLARGISIGRMRPHPDQPRYRRASASPTVLASNGAAAATGNAPPPYVSRRPSAVTRAASASARPSSAVRTTGAPAQSAASLEQQLRDREASVRDRENRVAERERELNRRERSLKAREKLVADKEKLRVLNQINL